MNYKYKIALSFAMPEQEIVETVYHYLKSKGITVFFAPTAEAQVELSGRNQREVFFDDCCDFGKNIKYICILHRRMLKHYLFAMRMVNIMIWMKHRNKYFLVSGIRWLKWI